MITVRPHPTELFSMNASVGGLAVYLDLFAIGMALAAVHAYVDRRGTFAVVEWIGRVTWLWWALAACSFWLIAERIGLPRSPQDANTPIGWLADKQQILQSFIIEYSQ